MWSGTTVTKFSGRIWGAHQKIDRVARRHLIRMVDDNLAFPSGGKILQFEGRNGPDGIKNKSPAKDEPWHYYSPFKDDNDKFIELITSHYDQLVLELKKGNKERTAFEAAWLAHTLVDGLTPAHHYPYEEKLTEIRGGEGIETRDTLKGKIVMPGNTKREMISNNWKMWGFGGLLSTHGFFEFGVASIIKPISFGEAVPTEHDRLIMLDIGPVEWFKRAAREIAVLDMYDRYCVTGWNAKLTLEVRQKLIPVIIRTVTLTWYSAMVDAGLVDKSRKVAKIKFVSNKTSKAVEAS
jgi:hypothetical protein